jgi:hypothetical protein
VSRKKVHHGLDAELPTGTDTRLTYNWISAGDENWRFSEPCSERDGQPGWVAHRPPDKLAPDVWVHSLSLWELDNTVEKLARRLHCELRRKPPHTLGILKLSSVYDDAHSAVPARAVLYNEKAMNHTAQGLQSVAESNAEVGAAAARARKQTLAVDFWHVFNPAAVLGPRRSEPGFTHDQVHYGGFASRTVSFGMLNIVAGCDALCPPREREICACPSSSPDLFSRKFVLDEDGVL